VGLDLVESSLSPCAALEIFFMRLLTCLFVLAAGCYISTHRGLTLDTTDDGTTLPEPDSIGDSWVDSVADQDLEASPCDQDSDGWDAVACGGADCNDDDADIHPGAHEICNDGIDQDCDGQDGYEGVLGEPLRLLDDVSSGALYTYLEWTGTRYVFLWSYEGDQMTWVKWIDAAGLEASEEDLFGDCSYACSMRFNGSVLGTLCSCENDLFYRTLDVGGQPLIDVVRITESGSAGGRYRLLRWIGDSWAVMWLDPRTGSSHLYFTRVTEGGTKLLPNVQVTHRHEVSWHPWGCAWTGSEMGVAWKWKRYEPGTDLFITRLDRDGNALADPVTISNYSSTDHFPVVQWTGSEYGIFWLERPSDEEGQLMFARYRADGGETERQVLLEQGAYTFSIVWTGAEYSLLWSSRDSSQSSLFFQRMSPSGNFIEPRVLISISPVLHQLTAFMNLVWTGSEYGIEWREYQSGIYLDVFFVRVGFCE
jgi:hypothetical protein